MSGLFNPPEAQAPSGFPGLLGMAVNVVASALDPAGLHAVAQLSPAGAAFGTFGAGDGSMVGSQDYVPNGPGIPFLDRDGIGGSGTAIITHTAMHPCSLNGHGGLNCGNEGPGKGSLPNLGSPTCNCRTGLCMLG